MWARMPWLGVTTGATVFAFCQRLPWWLRPAQSLAEDKHRGTGDQQICGLVARNVCCDWIIIYQYGTHQHVHITPLLWYGICNLFWWYLKLFQLISFIRVNTNCLESVSKENTTTIIFQLPTSICNKIGLACFWIKQFNHRSNDNHVLMNWSSTVFSFVNVLT